MKRRRDQLFDRFKYNGLFVKVFLIMVASIIAVSVTSTWSTIRVSERVFMETFSLTNSKIMDQIKKNMESFHYSLVLASNSVIQSATMRSFLTQSDETSSATNQSYYRMGQQMKRISSTISAYEAGITVTGVNERRFSTDRSYWQLSYEELKKHPITIKSLEEPYRLHYDYDKSGFYGTSDLPVIIASKALMDRTSNIVYGMIYFAMPELTFRNFYDSNTSLGNDIAIINNDGIIISSNREEWIGRPSPELRQIAQDIEQEQLSYKNERIFGKDQIIVSDYMDSFGLYMVNLIDKDQAIGQLTDTKVTTFTVAVIILVAVIIVFLISRRMTKSLTRLVKQISTISKYDFRRHVTVSGSYETKQLGEAFNEMIDELNEYVGMLIQTEKKRRNAELEALQQQINPHFLYNTLASIKFMVQQGEKEKAAETINALISLLQSAIGNVSETITIAEELENMKSYVFINHIRYGDRIKVSYFVAPDCLDFRVPKLIIQPFIENAFFHAFNRKSEGLIYIMAAREGDMFVFEIVDNGDGMVMEPGKLLPKSHTKRQLFSGIGVKNVNERIKLLYGEAYGVTIESELGKGTKVKIKIPLLCG
ncbi:sensor histidine kinase [Paenibacillus sp. NPDC058071]|uniref:cache domain-containing sensor histidine kinase n=1 Tax=Paenibacillus sp. NPDC058071 TaxID=3346326 RepID=UPI0036D99F5A